MFPPVLNVSIMLYCTLFLLHHHIWQLLWGTDGIWRSARCEDISPFVEKGLSFSKLNFQKDIVKLFSFTVFERSRIWVCDNAHSNTDFATVHHSCFCTTPHCKCKLGTWRTRLLSTRGKTHSI